MNDDEKPPCFANLVRAEHKVIREALMELTRTVQIGERIRTARERCSLSYVALAALTDGAISASRLANYESGLRRPGIEEAEALAKALGGVSAAWLLNLEDCGNPPGVDRFGGVLAV